MIHLPLVVPALILLFSAVASVWAVVRTRRLRAAWHSGVQVGGRCVSGYVVTRRRSGAAPTRTHRHVYEFATADGRVHRFEEAGGPATTVPGDTVLIRYPADRPDRATALAPSPGKATAALVVVLTFSGLLAAGALAFAVFYETQVADRIDRLPGLPSLPPPGPATPSAELPPGFPTDLPTGPPPGFPTGPPPGFPTDFPTGPPPGFPTDLPAGPPPGFPAPRVP
ncbi:DUF3592 domain-containing protein [Streptomyces sp. NBC_00249]|uniref:DUF3592 domain-containing protein n=1 Tax=Streptomyces sp. NBC_00249 TaxID=2975690 RepID=UPI00225C3826|nr:DUF3592 domain-containing protein [Streptomyces sp. NBC_00249]MCX5195448.1 DUF3592 domain-containing protein [Streptomyces sp. NBC_00249]